MTGTFTGGTVAAVSAASAPASGEKRSFVDDVEEQQLVLDVEGTRVYLAKKETGKRSQGANSTVKQALWDLPFTVPFHYKPLVLKRNFKIPVNKNCSTTIQVTLYFILRSCILIMLNCPPAMEDDGLWDASARG